MKYTIIFLSCFYSFDVCYNYLLEKNVKNYVFSHECAICDNIVYLENNKKTKPFYISLCVSYLTGIFFYKLI